MTRYRTGRKLGRTVYDGDNLIGVMDTPALGARVVAALNAYGDVVDATIVCGAQHPTHGWDCGLPEGHDGPHLADTTWWTWGDGPTA